MKVHGRTRLPLPASLEVGLRELGFKPRSRGFSGEIEEVHTWERRRAGSPNIRVEMVASNMPGESAVVASAHTIMHEDHAARWETDALLAHLATVIAQVSNPNVKLQVNA